MQNEDQPSYLGAPPLRQWNLTDDSSRYDRLVAASSDEALRVSWILWSSLAFVVSCFIFLVLAAILSQPRTRKNPFNLYLIHLMVPDLVFSLGCAITCAMNASRSRYYSSAMCRAQSYYLVWGLTANTWVNGIIAFQVHRMLKSSQVPRRYRVPSLHEVSCHSGVAYLWAAFVAGWPLMDWINPYHRINAIQGLACLPVEYSTASSLFYFLVYMPCAFFIPMTFTIGIIVDVIYNRLLPPRGRRRIISAYFFRVFCSFVIFWAPYLFTVLVGGSWMTHEALVVMGSWAHLQGLVSSAVSLMKPDISKAFQDFVFSWILCCCQERKDLLGHDSEELMLSSSPFSRIYVWFSRQSEHHTQTRSSAAQLDEDSSDFLPRQNEDFGYDDETEPSQALSVPDEAQEEVSMNDDAIDDEPCSGRSMLPLTLGNLEALAAASNGGAVTGMPAEDSLSSTPSQKIQTNTLAGSGTPEVLDLEAGSAPVDEDVVASHAKDGSSSTICIEFSNEESPVERIQADATTSG